MVFSGYSICHVHTITFVTFEQTQWINLRSADLKGAVTWLDNCCFTSTNAHEYEDL